MANSNNKHHPLPYNQLIHADCMVFMATIPDKSVDFVLTDIPYNAVNRESNGLRNLCKANADMMTAILQAVPLVRHACAFLIPMI